MNANINEMLPQPFVRTSWGGLWMCQTQHQKKEFIKFHSMTKEQIY